VALRQASGGCEPPDSSSEAPVRLTLDIPGASEDGASPPPPPDSTEASNESRYAAKGRPQKDIPYFEFARPEVVALIPSTARQLLDIGCGAGRLGQLLKQRQPVTVTGLELHPQAAALARHRLDEVLEQNVEDPAVEFSSGRFDCIVFADVLEHLREPATVLAKIRRWLAPDGCLVASLPNVRHHSVVSGLLDGNWTYEAAGLLDNDHVRFFTRREIEKLLYRQGFEITSLIPKPGPGHAEWVAAGRPGSVKAGSLHIEGLTPEHAEEFFTYQFLVVARPVADAQAVQSTKSVKALKKLRAAYPWPLQKPVVPIPKENLGWCGEATREVLKQELARPTQLVVELGAWLGLSTRLIADHAPRAHVITIDHWKGSPEHFKRSDWAALLPNLYQTFQSLTWEYRDRITSLRMSTTQGLQTIAHAGLQPDLIYIDADHAYESVTAELNACQLLFPHARLVGDDYDSEGVHRAVNEFAERSGRMVEPIGTGWRSWRLLPLSVSTKSPVQKFGLTSIIIVTHNQLGYTKECVESIRLRTDEPYELIFVDNGSTDGTPEYLASLADAQLIENTNNRGFPAAVNQGIARARGEQILLLNNDTVVSTGWLDRMLRALRSDPRIGLVGPSSNSVSGSQMIPVNYFDMSSMDGFAWDWGKLHAGRREETDRLIGFCLLVKRAVIDEIGVLDEQFGIGCFEDDDFCIRAIRAGWRAIVSRDAFVHHYGGRTFAGSGVDFAALMEENRRKFTDKWTETPPGPDSEPATEPVGISVARTPRFVSHPEKTTTKSFRISEAVGGGLLLTAARPKLSLCMIVRNNETTIRPCLESIRPWVDEMIVVDTGSTDSTPQICEELGAKVFHWPWRDSFSAARNESISHATGEWIFWMDSDDTIPEHCGQNLRELPGRQHPKNLLGFVMQVHCPGPGGLARDDMTVVDHVKLFRNRPDLRFEFRMHEQILPAIRGAGGEVGFTDIYVVHSGADHSPEGYKRKLIRDFHLLNLDLQERPDHPFVLFNLGMTYADSGQHDEAAYYLKRSVEVSQPEESQVRKAYALLVSVLYQQSRYDEALSVCATARRLYSDDKELLFRQAMLQHQLGQLQEAVASYQKVITDPVARHFSSVDAGLSGFKARHNLALVFEDQGRPDRAETEWQAILDERPGYHPAEFGLIECLMKQKHFERAEALIHSIEGKPDRIADGHYLTARLLESKGEINLALMRLQQGLDRIGNDPSLLREQARLLHATGDLPSAAKTLELLTSILPNDRTARNNLDVVMAELGQRDRRVPPQ